jgi:hypothetical protein
MALEVLGDLFHLEHDPSLSEAKKSAAPFVHGDGVEWAKAKRITPRRAR